MKVLSSIFFFLAVVGFVSPIYANTADEPLSDKYRKVVINMEDGTHKEGFIKEFRKTAVYSSGNIVGTKTIEGSFGLEPKSLVFKSDTGAKRERISIKDVKSIDFIVGVNKYNRILTTTYEKVKLASVRNNKKLKTSNTDTMLPVFFKNEKITVYSLTINETPQCYFKRADDEYALQHKVKVMDVFKVQNYTDRLVTMFEYIGRDCPEYLEWLKSQDTNVEGTIVWGKPKPGTKEARYYDIYENYRKDLKDARKEMTEADFEDYSEWRAEQKREETEEMMFGQYKDFLNGYLNICGEGAAEFD